MMQRRATREQLARAGLMMRRRDSRVGVFRGSFLATACKSARSCCLSDLRESLIIHYFAAIIFNVLEHILYVRNTLIEDDTSEFFALTLDMKVSFLSYLFKHIAYKTVCLKTRGYLGIQSASVKIYIF